ncbi:hypothetical protein F4804DRAFT_193317 [Jackrogersella minutella]|nr:hypothetical protein F4804DRAFT_193317 [Jackrogersella minutella]
MREQDIWRRKEKKGHDRQMDRHGIRGIIIINIIINIGFGIGFGLRVRPNDRRGSERGFGRLVFLRIYFNITNLLHTSICRACFCD